MTRFYKVLYIVISLLLLSWVLPWLLSLTMPERGYTPFTLYSEVLQDFVSLDAQGKEIQYYDRTGKQYTEEQFDSLLPSFYFRQLVVDNRIPDSIMGRSVTPELLRVKSFIFRCRPMELNTNSVNLYPLLESNPRRVDLEMPDDLFRLTNNGIEFIELETNTINTTKSALFQSVFDEKNVCFPIKRVAGNPTNRKPYDEGYFLVDAEDQLFHLKQINGTPFLRKVNNPSGAKFKHIFVTEYDARETFAFLFDDAGYFYLLTAPDYRIIKTELEPIDLNSEDLTIFGNGFFWTMLWRNDLGTTYQALERQSMKSVGTYHFPKEEELQKEVAQYIFPWKLRFTSYDSTFFKPLFTDVSWKAVPLGLLLALLYIILFYRREQKNMLIIKSVVILLAGIFAFIPFIILPRKKALPSSSM